MIDRRVTIRILVYWLFVWIHLELTLNYIDWIHLEQLEILIVLIVRRLSY